MKVKATYRVVFNVTREVDVPEDEFQEWARDRYQPGFDRDLAIAAWLDNVEDEFNSVVFSDFRTDKPLPSDFEFQYMETEDAVEAASDSRSS